MVGAAPEQKRSSLSELSYIPEWIINEGVHSQDVWGPPAKTVQGINSVALNFDWHMYTACMIVIDSLSMWAFMAALKDVTKGVRVRWLSPANRLVLGLVSFAKKRER